VDQGVACRFFICEITQHDVWSAGNNLADAAAVRIFNLHLNPGQGLAHRAGEHAVFGTGNGEHRGSFSKPIAFENSEAQALEVSLYLFIQGRATADEVTNPATHSFVNRIEEKLTEVEGSLISQPGVEPDEQIRGVTDELVAFMQSGIDAAMQHLP